MAVFRLPKGGSGGEKQEVFWLLAVGGGGRESLLGEQTEQARD